MVVSQVEDGFSSSQNVDRVCHYYISDLLIEISFPIQFMCILNINIEYMDVLINFLYMVDYIF